MRDRDAARLRRVLELQMAAPLGHLDPAVSLKGRDNVPAIHSVYLYTFGGLVNGWASHHLMHVDHHAVGMACGRADKDVLHQPAVFLMPRLELRHGAEVDQLGIDRLAALEL